MGRKSTRDSVKDRELDSLLASGVSFDQAFDIAWDKGTQAVEDKKAHRRKMNARYQWRHRWRKQYDEKIRLENERKESERQKESDKESGILRLSLVLNKERSDILDYAAKDIFDHISKIIPTYTMERARESVIEDLIDSLGYEQKKQLRGKEMYIGSLQLLIKSQRDKGIIDSEWIDEIQDDLDKLGLTIDGVMNYQFRTAKEVDC